MPVTVRKIGNDITWTDIFEPTADEIANVSRQYNLNTYTLTDSQDPDHLPKYEEHNDIHFIIVRLLQDDGKEAQTIQSLSAKIAIFYNDDFVLTLHRCASDIIEKVGENTNGNNISTAGITIRIIREALQTFERPALELSDGIDRFESKLFLKKNFPVDMIRDIYFLKNRAGILMRLLLLSNEVVSAVRIPEDDRPAHQDARDLHTKLMMLYGQVQEDANNLLNIYLSLSARKTNEVVKILTIFSVFFMPLTFIAGIYGMNFKYMPELSQKWGYPIALIAMGLISAIIYWWFRRKKWL